MEDALEDLEALMIKWKDMVKLAQDLNERLTAVSAPTPTPGFPLPSSSVSSSSGAGLSATQPMAASKQVVEPEEATFIRSSLAQLGLQMANAPVTQDMVRDERIWFEELAKELAGVLEGSGAGAGKGTGKGGEGMMRRRGIIALDEVWGGWNRARGVGECLCLWILPLGLRLVVLRCWVLRRGFAGAMDSGATAVVAVALELDTLTLLPSCIFRCCASNFVSPVLAVVFSRQAG